MTLQFGASLIDAARGVIYDHHMFIVQATGGRIGQEAKAALVPDMFCNFYLVKNRMIANNLSTAEAREKISTYLESLEIF